MYQMICDPRKNRLLAVLPSAEYEHLKTQLELVSVQSGDVLYEPGIRLQQVYFPLDCIVSLQHVVEDGAATEVAEVGREGIVGVSMLMGSEITPGRAVVLSAGYACRLKGHLLMEAFNRAGAMQHILLRYAQTLMAQMAQSAVCNRHHTLEQQLCCWLLTNLDRLPSDTLVMTHEFIANMLGMRRESVTTVVCRMRDLGLIEQRRRHIRVISRQDLEKKSCECYEVIKKEFASLLSMPAGESESAEAETKTMLAAGRRGL